VPVRWEVSENDSFTRVVRLGEAVARPEMGHSVHVEVEGLMPYRRYWYRFAVAGSDLSNVGTAVTAPLAGATLQRLRIGVGG
ncbi:PhoD-like phosphatase N-terminal domain-containing protein, partial [Acinetobacter baumannii]